MRRIRVDLGLGGREPVFRIDAENVRYGDIVYVPGERWGYPDSRLFGMVIEIDPEGDPVDTAEFLNARD